LNGYFVQIWLPVGRWSVLAFWRRYNEAERHRKRLIRTGQWCGRVPQIIAAAPCSAATPPHALLENARVLAVLPAR
jgi:hypothetical protein